jgi:hypothetical protein
MTRVPNRNRIEALAADEALVSPPADRSGVPAERLTEVERLPDGSNKPCETDTSPDRDRLAALLTQTTPSIVMWKQAVAELQQLHRDGTYRIAFFINMAPNECPGEDRFFDGGAFEDEAALAAILGRDTPVGSSVRAFLPYRPSQMPGARGHSVGNANRVKADALFDFITGSGVLPAAVSR